MSLDFYTTDYTQFRSISGLSKWVQGFFVVLAIIMLLALVSGYLYSLMLNDLINGKDVTENEILAGDMREGLISIFQILIYLIAGILFLVWVHRANKNLHYFEKPILRFTPGWAVGWFFVPFMNLYRPYQVIAEVAKASDPEVNPTFNRVENEPTPAIIKWWWALFLLSSFIGLPLAYNRSCLYGIKHC